MRAIKEHNMSKKLIVSAAIILLSLGGYSQAVIEKIVTLENRISLPEGKQTERIARDEVILKPGFEAKSSGGSFLAKVDNKALCIQEYQTVPGDPGSSGYPDNRELDRNLEIGSIPGSISVNALGMAVYNMELELPDGPSGLKPNLAVVYNSGGGNSILGQNFALAGISRITLSPATYYHDKKSTGITQNNIYSLDGQRLISQDYQYYFTEKESYQTIEKHGYDLKDTYFEIYNPKEKMTLEYGRVNNSKTDLEGFGNYAWMINTVTDKFNNNINFYYKESDFSGNENYKYIDNENILERIVYGQNEIEFIYSIRDDRFYSVYEGNIVAGNSVLLDRIHIKRSGKLLSTYVFKYITNNGYSCLSEVQLQNGSNEKLNSTMFRWNTPKDHGTYSKQLTYSIDFDAETDFKGDFDNDGKTELIVKDDSGNDYLFYDFDQDGTLTRRKIVTPDDTELICNGDFDGDGRGDILGYKNGVCYIFLINENGLTEKFSANNTPQDIKPHRVTADLNSNGISDIYIRGELFEFNPKTSSFEYRFYLGNQNNTGTGFPHVVQSILTGDFNNDGILDYILNGRYKGLSNSDGTYSLTRSQIQDYYYGAFDINNDGVKELMKNDGVLSCNYYFNEDLDGNGEIDSESYYKAIYNVNAFDWESFQPCITTIEDVGEIYLDNSMESYSEGLELMSQYPDEYRKTIVYEGCGTSYQCGRYSGEEYGNNYIDNLLANKSEQIDLNGDGKREYLVSDGIYNYVITTNLGSFTGYKVMDRIHGNIITGDFNGDGATDYIRGNDLHYVANPQRLSVAAIIDGNNEKIEIAHERFLDVFDNQVKPSYPLMHISGPFVVTNNIKRIIGNKTYTTSYSYKDSRVHAYGKGFLGFQTVSETSDFGQKISSYGINEKYIFPYLKKVETKNLHKGNYYPLVTSTFTEPELKNLGGVRYAFEAQESTEIDFNQNTVTKKQEYDPANGFLLSESVVTKSAHILVAEETTTYSQHIWSGSPRVVTTTMSRPGNTGAYVENRTFTYHDATGLLHTSTIKGLTKTYLYDSYGNVNSIVASGNDIVPRKETFEYDRTYHQYVTRHTEDPDGLNQYTKKTYNIWGRPVEEVDVNGVITRHTYNNWGKRISTTTPEGFVYTYKNDWSDTIVPENAFSYTSTFKDGMLVEKNYYDRKGLNIRSMALAPKGIELVTDMEYDDRGNLVRKTKPQPSNPDVVLETTYTYNVDDVYGRLEQETTPNLTIKYFYQGNIQKTKISKDNVTEEFEKEYDATGEIIRAKDEGGEIIYKYDNDNQLREINAPGDMTTTIKYNSYRHQEELIDPSAGTTSYTYYVTGEVETRTNANDETIRYEYDALGRIKAETQHDGTIYTYHYDEPGATGLLAGITSNSPNQESETYKYDNLGRVIERTRSNKDKSLTFEYEYDSKGRVRKQTYPSNFSVIYEYNEFDDLVKVRNASGNAVIWQLDDVYEDGQIKGITYGNGKQLTYEYDAYNRLSRIYVPGVIDFNYGFNDRQQLEYREEKYFSASNSWNGFVESFTYDNLNRLEKTFINNVETMHMKYDGDVNNRIESKTGLGTYAYASEKKHRLEYLEDSPYQFTEHDITYTSRLKVETIEDYIDEVDLRKRSLSIEYGIDNERFKQVIVEEDGGETITWFTENYEHVELPDGTERHLNYIFAGGTLIAINVESSDHTDGMHYVYTDYLGSIRCITDANGATEFQLGFGAWGNRRNPETGEALSDLPEGLFTNRGFTYHEHYDDFGLINMNGRVYDPALSLFLSPDPYVQAPDFTQNFNRYAYCL